MALRPGRRAVRRVGFQMVDGEIGLARRNGRTLGKAGADQQAADETRAGGGGDGAEIGKAKLGFLQRIGDQGGQGGEMRAGGDFRHDAAESGVVGDLAQHAFGQNGAVRRQDRGGGLIAGAFNS